MKNYFEKDTPLTIAMWDFSWLQCGHPGGSFEHLERCVAEAAERGYNTLRVDVFPHFYLEGEHHFTQRGQQHRIRSWGHVLQEGGYTVNVREKVIELADLCRKHDIWLGLDTWMSFEIFGQDIIPVAEEEKFCRDWADTWVEALKLMREDGVYERAAWVAPLNEIPIFLGNLTQSIRDLNDQPMKEVGDGQVEYLNPHMDERFHQLNIWMGEAVKADIEGDGVPLLYSGVWVEDYSKRVPDFYDAVDGHFMPDAQLTEADIIALEKAGEGASKFALHHQQSAWDFALFSAAWERACENNYDAMLNNARAFCEKVFSAIPVKNGKRRFEVISTEAYGPCNHPDHPEVDWTWYKHYNADAARIFAQYDFSGLTLSNHAEPLFSLWQDKAWHARGNTFIKNAAKVRYVRLSTLGSFP